jgi:3-methyl-2-oxobutanoate hydroxymethyltransferase
MLEHTPRIVRTGTLLDFKRNNTKFCCLTSYDSLTSGIFDEAGIDVLLVGDSAADNVLGYETTLPITVEEMIPFGRAVSRAANRALVVVDMPFGSYESGPDEALKNATSIMKLTGASAVKLEGGVRSITQIQTLVSAGIPVMAHIGFTPQSVHSLGGAKVQGRGDSAQTLINDALAVQEAGAFAVVLELVPADLASEVTSQLAIPTIGIGAGAGTDGQILVWTDFAGLFPGKPRKFVKQYANLRSTLLTAASTYKQEVADGIFPGHQNSHE